MRFIVRTFIGLAVVLLLTACSTGAPAQPVPPVAGATATPQQAGALPASPTPLATAPVQTLPRATQSVPLTDTPAATAVSTTAPPVTPTAIPSGGPSTATFVYNVTQDGSLRARDLTSGAEVILGDPTMPQQLLPWSAAPNGRTIALVTGRGWGVKGPASGWTAALWTVSRDGSQTRKLLDLLPADRSALQANYASNLQLAHTTRQKPVWTPDGSAVIIVSAHEGQADLYAVATDGSQIRRLTNSPAMEVEASIAPDGQAVAYISTTNFGTGGGWTDVRAEVIPLEGGQPRGLLAPAVTLAPAGAGVLGWTRTGAVLVAAYTPEPAVVITLTRPAADPEVIYQGAETATTWDAAGERLAIVTGDPAQPQSGATLRMWRPEQVQPETIASLVAMAEPHWAPDGQALLLCTTRRDPPGLMLWTGSELKDLGQAGCADSAWSAQGQLAVSGGDEQPGLLVKADGTLLGTLPPGAIIAGWLDSTLYYFHQTEGKSWQLMLRTEHEEAPIGQPLLQRPERVDLLSST
jgi:dipeptidyl aminopeptidase/acylaminoacyl peptidase